MTVQIALMNSTIVIADLYLFFQSGGKISVKYPLLLGVGVLSLTIGVLNIVSRGYATAWLEIIGGGALVGLGVFVRVNGGKV